ncbi:MAG: hypothetical protein IAE81_14210 [Caldilineaceae bacterium]|nr:hypothetical protein [Caldilineaceae bacterium]
MTTEQIEWKQIIRPLGGAALSLSEAGGKGANLNVLLRAGLPAPGGFVITTAAYQTLVDDSNLASVIEEQWQGIDSADATSFAQRSAALQAAFAAAVFPQQLVAPILQAYAGLGAGVPVAVRSSATAEDLPDASFAGQQDTYLNISGDAALLDAVKRCWASLWTARAMAYRVRQGIAPAHVALAVVVQVMAHADAAGVMFTVNPVTGADDEIVINAAWGLGEALVAGRVTPDTIIASKADGRIKQAKLGEKALMTALTIGGVHEVPVDEARRGQQAIDAAQVAELVRLGREIEAIFDGPQDVEWALVDGRVVLLQSRPVTATVSSGAAQTGAPGDDKWPALDGLESHPFDFWTQQDLGERWPDPVTPLTWSISEPMTQDSTDAMFARLKAPYAGKVRWCKRAFGHAWLNEGAVLYAYTHGYGMPMSMIESGLTHPGARPADAEGWRIGQVLRHLPWYWEVATGWERNAARFEKEFPKIERWVDDFMARDLSAMSDAALLDEARTLWYRRIIDYIAYHSNATSLSMSALTDMENFLAKHVGDATLAQMVAGGLSGVIAAEIAPDLWAMMQTLRAHGLDALVNAQPPREALAALRAAPAAAPFFDQLQRFLQRHGHRCMAEAELLYPRWSEAPEQVVEALAPYFSMETAPAAVGGSAMQRREAATAQIKARLNARQRRAFRKALGRLHHFTRMRDNGQNYVVKLLLPMRHLYAVLGERWAGRGWLNAAEDIFFLVAEELTAVVEAGDPLKAGLDVRKAVADRRAAYTYWFTQPTPDALDAQGVPVAVAATDGRTLTGMAASPGQVTGRARVVLSPEDASTLEPGDILVTRATDPGWTPVFSLISGVVLEIGGTLSHGAIVAREYGLPAVVNVPQATQHIQDGEIIQVDGTHGQITLQDD